jgi:hypothetical protein
VSVVFSQQWQFVFDENFDAHVLQADRVEHSRRCIAEPRRRRTFDGLQGNPFGDEAAEAIQVHQMGELQPIPKRSTGGNDGISEAQSANLHAEVNAVGGIHSPGGYHELRSQGSAL